MQDLERIERLRSLSHRIDCALGIERIDWYRPLTMRRMLSIDDWYRPLTMRRMWSIINDWLNFERTDLYLSMDELRELEDEVRLSLNL
jgi:hypothetical protein